MEVGTQKAEYEPTYVDNGLPLFFISGTGITIVASRSNFDTDADQAKDGLVELIVWALILSRFSDS